MAITFNRTGEHSLDVAGAEIFSKTKKTAAPRIGSVHGEMLIEFRTKNKIKNNLSTFTVKNMEKTKLIRFEKRRTIKIKIPPRSRQKYTHRLRHRQHSISQKLVLTFLPWLLMKAHDRRITTPPYPVFRMFLLPCRHKLWNVFISRFHNHSIHVKFPKINPFYEHNEIEKKLS